MNCKTCQKKFHACSGCCLSNDWEYHYCTERCWKASAEYKNTYNLVVNFLDSLTGEQLDQFERICELDGDYEFIIEDLIEKEHRLLSFSKVPPPPPPPPKRVIREGVKIVKEE